MTSSCRIIRKAFFDKWELAGWDLFIMVRDKGQRWDSVNSFGFHNSTLPCADFCVVLKRVHCRCLGKNIKTFLCLYQAKYVSVCVCVCVYIYIYIHTHTHTHNKPSMYVCVCVCVCMYVYIYIYTYWLPRKESVLCIYVDVYIYIYIYI